MNKISIGFLSLLVGLGLGFLVFHNGATPVVKKPGAQVQNDTFNFSNGFNAGLSNQLTVDSTGLLTTSGGIANTGSETITGSVTALSYKTSSVGVSTSSGATLGAAEAGFIAIPTGNTSFNATSTVIDLNSQVFLTQIATSTNVALLAALGSSVCSSNVATTTPTVFVYASTTAAGLNYFQLKSLNAPVTNPNCYSYRISN